MSTTLSEYLFNKKPKNVDFGVEIEVEGRNLEQLHNMNLEKWRIEPDGSLRGGVELVLHRPVKFNRLEKTLNDLKNTIDNSDVSIRSSDRTGIHLHMNVGDLTPFELVKFLCCYYILEEAIVETCGENRIGNHFCLRAIDAEYVISVISDSINRGSFRILRDEIIRYSALNLCALFRYGTVEFRAIQTTPNFTEQIMVIANILYNIKQNSKQFDLPNDILMEFSGFGVPQLLHKVITHEPSRNLLLSNPDLEGMCRRGMYLTQDIVYANNYGKDFTWGLGQVRRGEEVVGNQFEGVQIRRTLGDMVRATRQENINTARVEWNAVPVDWEGLIRPPEPRTIENFEEEDEIEENEEF